MIWGNIPNVSIPTDDTECKPSIVADCGLGKRTSPQVGWVAGKGVQQRWRAASAAAVSVQTFRRAPNAGAHCLELSERSLRACSQSAGSTGKAGLFLTSSLL